MKIGIDARMVSNPPDGAGRVMLSLISRLNEYPQHTFVIFHRFDAARINQSPNISYVRVDIPVSTLQNLFFLHRIVNSHHLDVFYYSFVDVPFFIRPPVVAEVYDLFYMSDRNYFGKQKRSLYQLIRLMTWFSLIRANKVIAISDVTARQVERLPFLKKSKIKVVPLAMSDFLRHTDKCSLPSGLIDDGYVLYVGNNRNHKNLSNLIVAYANVKSEVKLILAGKIDPRYTDPRVLISQLNANERIVHLGAVSDSMLATLYRNCLFVVVPSLYEGFGLPALEAASFGKAVLCSDISALREVMGQTTIYFDPHDVNSIESALRHLIISNDERLYLSELCFERSTQYGEDRFAKETLQALESACCS